MKLLLVLLNHPPKYRHITHVLLNSTSSGTDIMCLETNTSQMLFFQRNNLFAPYTSCLLGSLSYQYSDRTMQKQCKNNAIQKKTMQK